jgi:hypothetical protein
MRTRRVVAALPLGALLLAGSVQAQRAPAPDPTALAAASDMQRAGAGADAVAREVMSTHRQSGPQMVQILAAVRYPNVDIGRAVGVETRSSTATGASWLAQAAFPAPQAYAILYELDRASAATVGALVGAGYSVRDAVAGRQSIHPTNVLTHATDLRQTAARPGDVGGVLNNVLQASARDAARAMIDADYAVLDMVLALRDGYSLSPLQIGTLLTAENISAVQVLAAFIDPTFGLADTQAVTAFCGFGGEAGHAATLLRQSRRSAAQTASALTQAGYDVVTIGNALESAFQLRASAVVATLVDAGHTLAAASQWMRSEGLNGPETVVILRGVGATAQQNAQAHLASAIITPTQAAPFTLWARQAGYSCAETALPLRHEFSMSIGPAVLPLVQAECSVEVTAAALNAAFQATPAILYQALVNNGIGAHAAVQAMLAVGHSVNATLAACLDSSVDYTVAIVFQLYASSFPDLITLPDVFAWLKANNINENTAGKWARDAGLGATAVAVALRDGFGASAQTVGNALFDAGYDAVQVVTAFKDGIGLTLAQVTELASLFIAHLHAFQMAIIQVY